MTIIRYILPNGTLHELELADGTSVMEGSVANGLAGIVGECGGNAMCATCHVYVQSEDIERLPAVGDDEDEMLHATASPRHASSRLACQIEVAPELAGLTIRVAEEQ